MIKQKPPLKKGDEVETSHVECVTFMTNVKNK